MDLVIYLALFQELFLQSDKCSLLEINYLLFRPQELPVTMLNTGVGTGTYNTTTGAFVFTGSYLVILMYISTRHNRLMGFAIIETNTVNY
jgi:hypothetical protein